MANDNDSVDSNGNSTDLRPRRSNRAKGKTIQSFDETEENVIVHNNVVYKVGDFVYYLDKKQDIYRIGLIEEFKHQKRDKLVNKKPEIAVKQFYRLDEIPPSVLSNQGEYDTHVMPPNFPEWLRQREIFLSDNALSTSCNSLRSLCTVRHFPDLSHAMALFSSAQSSSSQVTNSSPRVDHHSLIAGKDNGSIPIPKQKDDNTFFYVYSYNARGRKLAATYLEIRVGPSYQAELPELCSVDDRATDLRYIPGAREQLIWKPNQIPEAVFGVYNMATISIACFSGFGGGVDDMASVENGRKIASHMLTCQKALDCLHKSQYNMEKAIEIFAENSLPETSKMPFLWTDEDHLLFDESVKIHGKNFLRIMQDKRNKKARLVGDYVTFYYYWKKNRPKNRKYPTKKNLRSRNSNVALSELVANEDGDDASKMSTMMVRSGDTNASKPSDGDNPSPSDASVECCVNCKQPVPKEEELSLDSDKTLLSDRMKLLCVTCQHYLRRYGYQKPLEMAAKKTKCSDDGDFEEGINGFDEEDDDEEGEEDEDDDVFPATNSPGQKQTERDENTVKVTDSKNTLAINKYDFDEEDENVEEVSSLLKRNHAKYNQLREPESHKSQSNGAVIVPSLSTNKQVPSTTNIINKSSVSPPVITAQSTKSTVKSLDRSNKRNSLARNTSADSTNIKKRKTESNDGPVTSTRSSSSLVTTAPVSGHRSSLLSHHSVRNQIHDSLKSTLVSSSHSHNTGPTFPTGSNNEKHSSVQDSNSVTSSSSSSSNDSSLSSDEAESHLSAMKRTTEGHKYPIMVKSEPVNEISADTANKDSSENSYNQMITSIPNIPGVCAVTNVGEPMPLLTQNLSTDLSATQPLAVSDLNIAEPLYKQLSIRNTSTTTSNASPSMNTYEAISALHKLNKTVVQSPDVIHGLFGPPNIESVPKFVNFNAISTQRVEGNPEETGLNLVKPKKRMETSFNESNWAPPHDSPSKLVHHRGDNSTGESGLIEAPKQMINDHEVVHDSIFGCLIRLTKTGEETCSRTDFQHMICSLKQADKEKKRSYINTVKQSDSSGIVSQDSCRRLDEIKKTGLMPPPIDKTPVAHQPLPSLSAPSSSSKNFPILSSSHSNSTIQASNQAHARKINNHPRHGLRSPSPVTTNNRPTNHPSTFPANMIRPNHMMNPGLHTLPNQANNQRQNMHMNSSMQSGSNTSLLTDYNNMNKVNMNDYLLYQNNAQNYEEMLKYQELNKLIMMQNLSMAPVRPMQWDQRFGSTSDGWGGGMPGPGVIPNNGLDLQNMLRAIGLTYPPLAPASTQVNNRPRSATGLNLTNGGACTSVVSQTGGDNKPGSGRASVNHDYQRQLADQQQQQQHQQQQQQQAQMINDSPEFIETLRLALAEQMYQNFVASNIQQQKSGGTGGGPMQAHPPMQNNGLGYPQQALLGLMAQNTMQVPQPQKQPPPSSSGSYGVGPSSGPTNGGGASSAMRQNDIVQMFMNGCARNGAR